ncbi:hypothetical protein CR513_12912, partial [Mucuna pruriens]
MGQTLNTLIAWPKSLLKLISIVIELDSEIIDRKSTIPLYLCQKDILKICTSGEMLCIFLYSSNLLSRESKHLHEFIDHLSFHIIGNKKAIEIQKYLQQRLNGTRN